MNERENENEHWERTEVFSPEFLLIEFVFSFLLRPCPSFSFFGLISKIWKMPSWS